MGTVWVGLVLPMKSAESGDLIMKRMLWLAVASLLVIGMGGCTYSDLTPAGSAIRFASQNSMSRCQYVGMVFGKGGGGGGAWVSNESLARYAMNDLRNKAAMRGATHVVMKAPQFGSSEGTTTSVTVIGIAYRCR